MGLVFKLFYDYFRLWCCVCVPYCIDSCQKADHYCPNCSSYLGSNKHWFVNKLCIYNTISIIWNLDQTLYTIYSYFLCNFRSECYFMLVTWTLTPGYAQSVPKWSKSNVFIFTLTAFEPAYGYFNTRWLIRFVWSFTQYFITMDWNI